MELTIWNWLIVATVGFVVFCAAAWIIIEIKVESFRGRLIVVVSGVCIVALSIFAFNWYNTSTASGRRDFKSYKSELNNGLVREITITAEDGREIFHYEGKFDVEDDGQEKHIVFENEEGKRIVIYYGITDTVIIEEK